MSRQRTPVIDLTDDPARLAALVAAPWRPPTPDEAVVVAGTLPNGRRVYARVARGLVDSVRPAAPAPTGARHRDAAARVRGLVQGFLAHEREASPPASAGDMAAARIAAIAANLARTPVRVGTTPAPAARRPSPTGRMSPERRRELLGHTAAGRAILDRERRAELQAAARKPAPISARVRRLLSTDDLGRRVLADRAERDPAGEAAAREAAGGISERRRRELLADAGLGRAILDREARGR